MATTNNLGITLLSQSQSQKEVTVNEAITILDAFIGGGVLDKDLTAPPGSPSEGARYIVAASATGDWSGQDDNLAYYFNGAWRFVAPGEGLFQWVVDESLLYVYSGGSWAQFIEGVVSASGATTALKVIEEELTLSGATTTSTIEIPDRAIALGVSTRTTEAITGATSYDAGVSGEADKFGATLGVSLGASNAGVIGPTAYYAATPIVLTANGSDFTGGKVRVAIHYIECGVPQS